MTEVAQQEQKKGIFSGWLPKILILIAVIIIASIFIFGMKLSVPDIIFTILKIVVAGAIILLVVKGLESFFVKPEFSPTRRWREKLTRVAELSKPFNTKDLYLRGEDMRVYSKWGKISGLAFVPYLSAPMKKDANGNYLYTTKRDRNGQIINDKKSGKPLMIHDYGVMNEQEGDWVFIISRGFWIFAQKEIVRAHKALCSDIGEVVWIKTPNLVPYGDYFYPTQQWHTDILRIMQQHQSEAILETHTEFLDLVAHITTLSLKASPDFRRMQEQNIETIQATPAQIT